MNENQLVKLLQELYDRDNSEDKSYYESALQAGLLFTTTISNHVSKSKVKLYCEMIPELKEAIQISAKHNGIELE